MSMTTVNQNSTAGLPWKRLGQALAKDWWLLASRGLLAVIFGGIALVMPVATILALVLMFSIYMLVDGCISFFAAVRSVRRRDNWGMMLLQGFSSIAAGVLVFLWPEITVLVFVLLLAAWSIVSGCLMLNAARNIEGGYGRGWMIFGGIVSLLFGFLMILSPLIGAVVLASWLGAYSLVFGVAIIVLAFRLRSTRGRPQAFGSARPAT